MTDVSDAADLTETARELLLRELLPALPADLRYPAHMIANAMAIAVREQRLGPAVAYAEGARWTRLMPHIDPHEPKAEAPDLPTLRRAVCRAIRAGAFDGREPADALVTALTQTAHDWLAISNPKALRTDSDESSAKDRHR